MNDRPTANVFFNNGEKCPLGSVINKFQHAKFLVYIIHLEDPPNEINSNRTSEKKTFQGPDVQRDISS